MERRPVRHGGCDEPTEPWRRDLTGQLERAIRSLEAHRVYLEVLGGDFDPRTFLTGIHESGGQQLGVEHGITVQLIDL